MSLKADIEKDFGSFRLRVNVEAGDETLALLGASGCGKSLTLRCIAGIEKPDRGHIELNGVTLFDSKRHIDLSPQKRRTGLMFQNYALFPNMTVLQNIRAGARREKDRDSRERHVQQVMESFSLTALSEHLPSQLSGGQQQRVALARILVSEPEILLLDEPFSALDSHLRFRLETELRGVIRDYGKTVVLVSHDRDEVFRLSDRIAVMKHGIIERSGSREEVFSDPGSRNGARLTGCKNISPLRWLDESHIEALDWGLRLKVKEYRPECSYVGIRVHELRPGEGENSFEFRIEDELENPFSYTLMLRPCHEQSRLPIGWETGREQRQAIKGSCLRLRLPEEALLLLKE